MKPSKPNSPLNNLRQTILSMSNTTMQTTAALPTTPSSTTAPYGNNDSPIAGSMPTSKMVWQRAIRDITEGGRKQLLHAMARWPEAVDLALWPYALRYAVHLYNTVPVLEDGISRLELFAGTQVGKRMRDHHTFACPVFALQNSLAAGNSLPRWTPSA